MIFAIHQHESATGIHAPPILNPTHLPSYSVYMSIPIFQFIPPLCFLISHASKIMLKILQARLQQYMSQELPDVQAGFRKEGTRDQIANISWITEKTRKFQKNIYFCFIDYTKAFDCVDHNELWKILKEMRITNHVICLLKNLYAGQEATVRTEYKQWTGSKLG